MGKVKITFILVLFCMFLPAITEAQTNQMDTNGKRHGIWKKFYQNQRIRYQGEFNHGKEIGTFKYYSAAKSEFPTVIKKFNANNDIADVSFFKENGKLLSQGKMNGKKRIGQWQYFHGDGTTVMSVENYLDDKLHGEVKTFYNTGKPTEIAFFKNGMKDSVYRKYSIKGHLYQHFTYKSGKLNGKAVYYNRKTGELTTKGQFKDDVRVGTWENYIDGELISTEQPNKKKPRPKLKSKTAK